MEFTFWHQQRRVPMTLTLRDYDLIVSIGDEKQTIPYACVTEIRLGRRSGHFFMEIDTLNNGFLCIESFSARLNAEPLLQERNYQTFVRILHLHLQAKSTAKFLIVQSRDQKLVRFSCLSIVIAGLFFLGLRFQVVDGFPWIVFVFFLAGLCILALPFTAWPKSYLPSNIPLKMLPSSFRA